MASVLDVAKHILEKQGQKMTTLKLQKLTYYAQAWAVARWGRPLFPEPVKAWAQGPVVPVLFQEHRSRFIVDASAISGDAGRLSPEETAHVDEVVLYYGRLPAGYLSALTHDEAPWRDSRESGYKSPTITIEAMRAFYGGKTPESLEADYQFGQAKAIMDEHQQSLARLAR